jgi:BclA C-terminal domain
VRPLWLDSLLRAKRKKALTFKAEIQYDGGWLKIDKGLCPVILRPSGDHQPTTNQNPREIERTHSMYSLIQLKTLISFGRHRFRRLPLHGGLLLVPVILACFAFLPQLRAAPGINTPGQGKYGSRIVEDARALMPRTLVAPDVSPPPDGGYGGSTAEGHQALFHLTTGGFETALGWRSLYTNTTASYNTGVGAGTLALSNADENTASGAGALLLNTTGAANTATGALSLIFNSTGADNAAFGDRALEHNTSGSFNIALGSQAGFNLTTGNFNIDIGNLGVAGDGNVIRIGDQAVHDTVFLAGIVPMVPEVPLEAVIVDPATGQLGRASFASLPVGGLTAVLFDFNNGAITIGVGGAVPFNQAPLLVGTAISKKDNTTFMVSEGGVYRISYTLRTALLSLLANVQVHVNGAGVGPTAALVVAGTSISDQVTFMANAGDTLQLVVGGVALSLGAGDNATINIDKLQ